MTLMQRTITLMYDDVQGDPCHVLANDAFDIDGVEVFTISEATEVVGAVYDEENGAWTVPPQDAAP